MDLSASAVVALLVSGGIVVLSVWGFLAFADQDYRLRHTDTTVTITEDDEARDFHSFDARELQIFEDAMTAEGYVSEVSFNFPDRVQRNDTYYDFKYTSAYDWSQPRTVVPILTFLGGLLGVVASVRLTVR